jgi:hypothetical protein
MASTPATLNLEASVTTGSGLSVDINVLISYPEGYGLYVNRLIEGFPGFSNDVIAELFDKDDASVVRGAEAATSPADAERGSIKGDATLTTEDNVSIPMSFDIDYPVGYGALILPVLDNIASPDSLRDVTRRLLNEGDASVMAALMAMK